jgi:hypothetical protein
MSQFQDINDHIISYIFTLVPFLKNSSIHTRQSFYSHYTINIPNYQFFNIQYYMSQFQDINDHIVLYVNLELYNIFKEKFFQRT